MRVLIVHPQMALYGGAEVVIVKLANYLKLKQHTVSILTLTTADHEDYKGLHFVLPEKEDERIQYQLRGSVNTLVELGHIYQNLKKLVDRYAKYYDVIVPHNFPAIWTVPHNTHATWMCNEIPDLWHNQNINKLVNPFLNAGRFGDRLIVDSKHAKAVVADRRMAKAFEHRYNYEPYVISYGIDGEFFYSYNVEECERLKKKYGIKSTDFNIIQPSMISPSKQQLELLKAVNILKKDIPNITVLLTGYRESDHPYLKEVMRYIMDNQLNVIITDMGKGTRAEMPNLYHIADLAVLNGRGQGSWLSPFESLVAKCPVIVSPSLTCSDIILENHIGLVVQDTVYGIKAVYNNQDYFKLQATKGSTYVLNNLTWRKYCESFEKLLWR